MALGAWTVTYYKKNEDVRDGTSHTDPIGRNHFPTQSLLFRGLKQPLIESRAVRSLTGEESESVGGF